MTFKEVPPVKGFWSITLYDKFHFLAPNAIDRFSLGTKSSDLRFEADGSLVIHVQKDRPERRQVSELAAGARRHVLTLYPRLLAAATIAEGSWTPPAVVPA